MEPAPFHLGFHGPYCDVYLQTHGRSWTRLVKTDQEQNLPPQCTTPVAPISVSSTHVIVARCMHLPIAKQSFGNPVRPGPGARCAGPKSTEACWIRQVLAKGIDAERPRRHSQKQSANEGPEAVDWSLS
ncbi:hypothetical protein QR685DRAFT_569490 [Neurospora intermedia]|uniref:Uncharacterized protein n=1 Tax=Neurospora intermedia TaxID=5142 RepID=A0ABR3DM43_NEUIN